MIGAHFVVVCDYKLTCFHGVWRGPLRGMFMDNSPVFLRLLLIVQYNAKERRYYAADMDSLNGIFVVEDDGMIRLEPLVWRPIHVGVRVAAAVASDWGRKGGGCVVVVELRWGVGPGVPQDSSNGDSITHGTERPLRRWCSVWARGSRLWSMRSTRFPTAVGGWGESCGAGRMGKGGVCRSHADVW